MYLVCQAQQLSVGLFLVHIQYTV